VYVPAWAAALSGEDWMANKEEQHR
jgi:hypothetical protein